MQKIPELLRSLTTEYNNRFKTPNKDQEKKERKKQAPPRCGSMGPSHPHFTELRTRTSIRSISSRDSQRSLVQESMLKCSICLEDFNAEGRRPKVLPYCGHVLCEICLDTSLKYCLNANSLKCHLCKKDNPLDYHQSMETFPTNWVVLELIQARDKREEESSVRRETLRSIEPFEETYLAPEIIKANICTVCNTHEISHFCRQHMLRLCAYCALRHMKECRPDKMTEITELPLLKTKLLKNSKLLLQKLNTKLEDANETKQKVTLRVEEKFEQMLKAIEDKKKDTLAHLNIHCFQLAMLKKECEKLLDPLIKQQTSLQSSKDALMDETQLKLVSKNINSVEEFLKRNNDKVNKCPNINITFDDKKRIFIEENIDKLCKVEIISPLTKENIDFEDLLNESCEKGNREMVEFLLLNRRIDINKKDQNGQTPFILALTNREHEICKLLHKKYSANINIQDNAGKTPLILCCLTNEDAFARYLLKEGKANPNLQTIWKDTALHCAVENNNMEIVKLLLAAKADTNLPNSRGKTPLDLARNSHIRTLLCKQAPTKYMYTH